MEAQVEKSSGLRPGRGFSLSEVHKVGLTVHQVRKLGIYVDPRRKTFHEFNVQNLKTLIETRKKQLEEEAEIIKKEREEIKEKKKAEEKEKKEKKKRTKKKKVEEKFEEKKKKEEKPKDIDLTQIKGIGKKKAEEFESAGILTVADLLKADTEELSEKTKFSTDYIEKLKGRARSL
ncbi:MAG: ribosomal protein L13e [Theionarchaea archaeon]|nr:ribosomal protein L13e [Theionarchaea archaeon]